MRTGAEPIGTTHCAHTHTEDIPLISTEKCGFLPAILGITFPSSNHHGPEPGKKKELETEDPHLHAGPSHVQSPLSKILSALNPILIIPPSGLIFSPFSLNLWELSNFLLWVVTRVELFLII